MVLAISFLHNGPVITQERDVVIRLPTDSGHRVITNLAELKMRLKVVSECL